MCPLLLVSIRVKGSLISLGVSSLMYKQASLFHNSEMFLLSLVHVCVIDRSNLESKYTCSKISIFQSFALKQHSLWTNKHCDHCGNVKFMIVGTEMRLNDCLYVQTSTQSKLIMSRGSNRVPLVLGQRQCSTCSPLRPGLFSLMSFDRAFGLGFRSSLTPPLRSLLSDY